MMNTYKTLVKSPVVFDEGAHTYNLGDKQLHGITGMIGRQLFPNKYHDVPKFILERAAERGHHVHSECQFVDESGLPSDCTEAQQYRDIRVGNGFYPLANEYTVSDLEYFASNIDCVWCDEDSQISLADIKTTYSLDEEYLSWQLSIYAYLFELQNPGLKVKDLYGVWLYKGEKAELVPIQRKSDEEVIRLLTCEKEGRSYYDDIPHSTDVAECKYNNPAQIADALIDNLIAVTDNFNKAKQMKDDLTAAVLQAMQLHNVKSFDAGRLKATVTPGTTKRTFDSTRFKKDHPDMYEEYMKESVTKDSVRITIREDKE